MTAEATQTVDTTQRLTQLREILAKETPRIDAFVVPSVDARMLNLLSSIQEI